MEPRSDLRRAVAAGRDGRVAERIPRTRSMLGGSRSTVPSLGLSYRNHKIASALRNYGLRYSLAKARNGAVMLFNLSPYSESEDLAETYAMLRSQLLRMRSTNSLACDSFIGLRGCRVDSLP